MTDVSENKKLKVSNDCNGANSSNCNGDVSENGIHPNSRKLGEVICAEMCFFCFDVLDYYLNKSDPPSTPTFPNDC